MTDPLTESDLKLLAEAWLEHAGYPADSKNIVGEPLVDVVMDAKVPQRIHSAVFDAFGIDLSKGRSR